MSTLEWTCQHCTYGPMPCSVKVCDLCQDPQQAGDCGKSKPTLSGLPPHPPPSGKNVSRGIAVGRKPARGGSRKKRKNTSRKYKRRHI